MTCESSAAAAPAAAPRIVHAGCRVASIDVGVKKLGLAIVTTRGNPTRWRARGDTAEHAMVRFIEKNCYIEHIENIDLMSYTRFSGKSGHKLRTMSASERSDMVIRGLVDPRLDLFGLRRSADGRLCGDPSLSAVVVETQPRFNPEMVVFSETISVTLYVLFEEVLRANVRVHGMTGKWKMDVCKLFAPLSNIDQISARDKYEWNKRVSVATVDWLVSTIPGFMSARALAYLHSLPADKRRDVCDAVLQGVVMAWRLELSEMGRRPAARRGRGRGQ